MKNLTIHLSLIFVLLLSLLLSNCRNPKKQESIESHSEKVLVNKDLIIIDLDTLTKNVISYSDIFSSIKYIPLETTSECLIGQIEHIELFNDTLYVLDTRQAKCILLFNLSGKFVQRIGTSGKGPGEWTQPTSFTIDKSNRLLYVLDANLQRITILTLKGRLVNQFDLNGTTFVRSHYLECDHGRIFLDARHYESENKNNDYLIKEIDGTGEVISTWFSYNKDNKGWNEAFYISGSGSFYSAPSDIKYVDLFMDTIYSINKEGIKPFIAIKSSKMIKKETLSNIQELSESGSSYISELYKEDGFWGINSYIENNDLIHFVLNGGRNYNLILIDKYGHQIKFIKGLKDDMTYKDISKNISMPKFYCGEKNMIIGSFSKVSAFQQALKVNNTNLSNEEKDKLLSISELSNPILIIATTKEMKTE
jgi:hypothetical protein